MSQFYRLMVAVLLSGTLAGLILFAVQRVAVVPLIEKAERFETGAHDTAAGAAHEHADWQPADGWERAGFTALTTVLSAVGFAAILFGLLALCGKYPNASQGALWGLAAFACFHLAPALGLPPEPPGVALADLEQRQLWWIGTVGATAIGLWLLASAAQSLRLRVPGGINGAIGAAICGAMFLAAPHILGAPAGAGPSAVPPELVHRFTIASLGTSALFWPLLGAIGGRVYSRQAAGSY